MVSKDHYYRLASELAVERIQAATQLLSELANAPKEDWDYALNRLTKGLITTRQSARFGFFMALTEVVSLLIERKELTLEGFLELVLDVTQLKASMKGKEERSVLFGRLFGLQILMNSPALLVSSKEFLYGVIFSLIELSNMKSWLRETTIFALCQFMELIVSSDLDADLKTDVLSHILQLTNDQGLNLSTEGIAIYLSIPRDQRATLAASIQSPKSNWKNGDPLSKGNLPLLAKALKDVDIVEPEEDEKPKNSKQKGSWSPKVPFVWQFIFKNFNEEEEIVVETSSKKRNKQPTKTSKSTESYIGLEEFWKVVVDETLFAEKSSHERKYWGFEIFTMFLQGLQENDRIAFLFTPNFLRSLINQSSQANRMLHKIAVKSLESIDEVSKKNASIAPVILTQLLDESKGGCWNFDLVTKSRTTDNLITVLSKSESSDETVFMELRDILVKKFKQALGSQKQEENAYKNLNDNVLKWSLDKLLLLIRNSKNVLKENDSSKHFEDVLKLLIKHSFFSTEDNNVSQNIRKLCQERLNSLLSDIILFRRSGHSWSLYCVNYYLKLERSSKYTNLVEIDEELLSVKEEATQLLESIQKLYKVAKDKKDQLYCFELMFSMVLIQFFMEDEEAALVLGEIKMCYEDTFDAMDEEKEGNTSVVLTEVILSFASRKSTLLKKFSSIVWETFLCGTDESGKIRLTEECLQLMFDVLVTRENKEGQQQLFDEGAEFIEDEEEEEEEEEEEDEEEEDDSELESEDDDALAQVEKDTNMKLASALGIPTGESGEVKFADLESDDEDSYESDSMDDEQMMAMDDQLSKIFKERRDALASVPTGNKRKAEVVDAKEQMIFFKSRILDLLELLSKTQSNSYLNLTIIKPLLTLINLTTDKNVGVKAHKLLKSRIAKTKVSKEELDLYFPEEEEKTKYKQQLLELLEQLQKEASTTKSSNQAHTMACNQACIIISKNLVGLDGSYLEQVIDLYSVSLKTWATDQKNNIQASLFFDFINWLNSKRTNKE